jgi:hypothetical protein
MSKIYLAVDIGKDGALATIKDGVVTTYRMPKVKTDLDVHTLVKLVSEICLDDSHVIFEHLGVIFGSGKSTALSMGYQSGVVEASCICAGTPYTKVKAKEWQKDIFKGLEEISKPSKTPGAKPVRDTKAMALVAVKRIFPNLKLTFGDKATVPHDGLIDAVLIAEWARRNNL